MADEIEYAGKKMPAATKSRKSRSEEAVEESRPKLPSQAREALPQALSDADGATRASTVRQLNQEHGNAYVHRLVREGTIMRKVDGEGAEEAVVGREGGQVPSSLESTIRSERGSGDTLDSSTSSQMGKALGRSFEDVRVHTDAKAHGLAKGLSASAFTVGNDIFFSNDAYRPGTVDGNQLLAHELTHVRQQDGDGSAGPMQVGAADDRSEAEADTVAAEAVAGREAQLDGGTESGSIARKSDDDSPDEEELEEKAPQ